MVEDVAGAPECLVGRELELAVLEEFLGSGGIAPILVVTGGPGIGKTALWEAGLRVARGQGIRVLAARPSEAEAQHSFAALFDLLEGISAGVMDELPVPQRRALEAALLRSEPMPLPPEPFAIAGITAGGTSNPAAPRVPFPGQSSELASVTCLSSSNCWAVGEYIDANGADLNQVLHWNGTTWAAG